MQVVGASVYCEHFLVSVYFLISEHILSSLFFVFFCQRSYDHMGQLMRFLYLSRGRAMKAPTSLCKCTDWPEPLLLVFRKY